MHFRLSVIPLICCSLWARASADDSLAKKTASVSAISEGASRQFCKNVIGVLNPVSNCNENYIFDQSLYSHKVDTLPQIKFWRNIMNLHEDTAIISFATSREFIQKININDW